MNDRACVWHTEGPRFNSLPFQFNILRWKMIQDPEPQPLLVRMEDPDLDTRGLNQQQKSSEGQALLFRSVPTVAESIV